MTKIIITGILAKAPVSGKLPSGRNKVTVTIIEQTYSYGGKMRENKFEVVYTGKRIKQAASEAFEKGDTVVVIGQLNGKEFANGKILHFIYGQQLVLAKKIKEAKYE